MPARQPLPTFQALLTCLQGPSPPMESAKLPSWPQQPPAALQEQAAGAPLLSWEYWQPGLQAHSRCLSKTEWGLLELRFPLAGPWVRGGRLAGAGGPHRALGPGQTGSRWLPRGSDSSIPACFFFWGPTAQRSLLPRSPPGSPGPIQGSTGPAAAKCRMGVSAVSPSLSLDSPNLSRASQPAGTPVVTWDSSPSLPCVFLGAVCLPSHPTCAAAPLACPPPPQTADSSSPRRTRTRSPYACLVLLPAGQTPRHHLCPLGCPALPHPPAGPLATQAAATWVLSAQAWPRPLSEGWFCVFLTVTLRARVL